jgi:hypothetical protein
MQRLGVGDRLGITLYDVTNNIRYRNIDPNIKSVNILSIVPFADLSDTDEIVIPQGQDKNLMDLIFDFIARKVETDNVTDNN